MHDPDSYAAAFAKALPFDRFVDSGRSHEQANWRRFAEQCSLTDAQRTLVGGFRRRINVLCLAGLWCGDCVQQCPILHRIAEACPAPPGSTDGPGIDLRFIDRSFDRAWSSKIRICGGDRVPVAVFLNEEFDFVSLMGDRPLSRYRVLASSSLGASCPFPGAPVPRDQIAADTQDWLNEFERIALLLLLSPKLRARHGSD